MLNQVILLYEILILSARMISINIISPQSNNNNNNNNNNNSDSCATKFPKYEKIHCKQNCKAKDKDHKKKLEELED